MLSMIKFYKLLFLNLKNVNVVAMNSDENETEEN